MKHFAVSLLVVSLSTTVLADPVPLEYAFEQVRRKVVVASGDGERRASEGQTARSGDRVRTGWMASAVVAVRAKAARFEIFPSSEVLLAGDRPGVILSLERGRLEAIFEKLTGTEPRAVSTPGAVLAVRGTRFGVDVAPGGDTMLVVFEGAVEVISPLRPQPLVVGAGELCRFSRRHAPVSEPMPRGMNESSWRRGRDSGSGPRDGSRDGMRDGKGRHSGDSQGQPPTGTHHPSGSSRPHGGSGPQ